MNIFEIAEDIYLVDLPMELEGFRKFISSWILRDDGKAAIIDVGPTSTIPKLLEAIRFLGIRSVEYVLLTHVHLDHAGGIAEFLKHFPEAKVVVHEKGERHVVNPEKLWKASLSVLGEIAEAYGKPEGIPESKIHKGKIEFAGEEIDVIDSPGHASHHQSYVFREFLFVGEAFGVHMPLKSDYYLRPATPPKFVYDIAYATIEKLRDLGSYRLCFAHFGFKRDSREIAEAAGKQLKLWVEVVYDIACRRDFSSEEEILKVAKSELLEKDGRFSRYHLLDEDIKRREDFFIENSLRGILEYVYENYCRP